MDRLTFVVELVKALAWPVAVFVLYFLLRGSILPLIPNLSKLKWKEMELEFRDELREVKAEIADVLPDATNSGGYEPSRLHLPEVQLAHISPRAAIIEAWLRVQNAALTALAKRGYEKAPFPHTSAY